MVEVGKAFFTNTMATAFNDPRLTLMIDDAARYLQNEGKGQNYDVIICDSSDPVGPAEVLFQSAFFMSMRDALSPTGVICTQGKYEYNNIIVYTYITYMLFAYIFIVLVYIYYM